MTTTNHERAQHAQTYVNAIRANIAQLLLSSYQPTKAQLRHLDAQAEEAQAALAAINHPDKENS